MNRRETRRLKKMRERAGRSKARATCKVMGETALIRAALQRALTFLQAGQPREALQLYRQVLKNHPDHADALNQSGIAAFQVGDVEQALKLLHKAITVQPDHVDAHNNLGKVLKASERFDEAEAAYRRALEIMPDYVSGHFNLGIVLEALDRPDDAEAAYRRALELKPDFEAYINRGNGSKAWAASMRRSVHTNLGFALQKSGRLDEAIDTYRRHIGIAPNYPDAHVNLSDALLERGDVKAALQVCDAYLEGHPGDTTLLAWKAVVLHELGEQEAERTLVDFDRFIGSVHLEAPAPFSSLAEFNAALADHVSRHPTLVYHPHRNATRCGKHSGELLAEPKGPVAHLEEQIRGAVNSYIRSLPVDPGHPFLNNPPPRFDLTAWCVIMEGQGHQVPHIHTSAWLSGVYYVRLPEIIGQPGQGENGWIEFGRPPDNFHWTAEPEVRTFQPEQGLMLLFPSYFYHRTLSFESEDVRISIAFDVVPMT